MANKVEGRIIISSPNEDLTPERILEIEQFLNGEAVGQPLYDEFKVGVRVHLQLIIK